jgi:hypothetical protein
MQKLARNFANLPLTENVTIAKNGGTGAELL